MAKKKVVEEGPRSFARFFEQVCDGDAHTEASVKLHALITELDREANSRGRASGRLVVTLGISCDDKGKADISFDVTTKEPKHKNASGTAWLTEGGNLTFTNPKQQILPLHDVNTRAVELADDDDDGIDAVVEG